APRPAERPLRLVDRDIGNRIGTQIVLEREVVMEATLSQADSPRLRGLRRIAVQHFMRGLPREVKLIECERRAAFRALGFLEAGHVVAAGRAGHANTFAADL